jgi:hypothetical protein
MRKIFYFIILFPLLQMHKKLRVQRIKYDPGNLFLLSNAKTRSISPENPTGEPGKGGMATLENGSAHNAARELGQGWKVNPFVTIKAKETYTIARSLAPEQYNIFG